MHISDAHPHSRNRRLKWLLLLLIGVGLASILFRRPVQDALLLRSLLRADAPSETAFHELADRAGDPFPLLQRVWNTQKVLHRALVALYLKENAGAHPELYRRAKPLLLSAAFDVDASVRELALATLAQQKHSELPRLAIALLRDLDPEMRLLGLQYLRKQEPATALPVVFQSLDDPDPRVITSADSALRNWTKQDFGVRINQALSNPAGATNAAVDPANLKIIQNGVQHWKEWWADHKRDYATNPVPAPPESNPPSRLPAADFALNDLSGRTVRLSEFKGKGVLLNFWTTWCTSCLIEIPDLIELQKKNAERVVVLGISLDGQTEVDEHGHLVGEHSDKAQGHDEAEAHDKIDLAEIRAKVEQFVKDKGINYRVLLDPRSEVGRRFNGGELPTTVLIDPEGYVRRRFLGGRAVGVFEAMIQELEGKTAAH